MQKEYTIEVIVTPHTWDNKENPYFWCIKAWDSEAEVWYTKTCGWSKSSNDAWVDANKEYIEIKK